MERLLDDLLTVPRDRLDVTELELRARVELLGLLTEVRLREVLALELEETCERVLLFLDELVDLLLLELLLLLDLRDCSPP